MKLIKEIQSAFYKGISPFKELEESNSALSLSIFTKKYDVNNPFGIDERDQGET